MRRLIVLALAAASASLVLAACGGDDASGATPTKDNFGKSTDPSQNIPKDQLQPVNMVLAGSDWYVGTENFVFGITNAKDEPEGGAKAIATFYDLKDPNNPKPVGTPQEAVQSAPGVGPKVEHKHANGETHVHGGEDDNRVGYYVRAKFDHAGFWGVSVDITLKDGTHGQSNIGFQVGAKSLMPSPGQAAYKSDNLTAKDVAKLSEIDSGDPPNGMHDVKIKDAIANGRPLVIVFSTPAFCTSRFCGPVTEEVDALHDHYKDKVDFVHIEIWRDFDKKILNPTAKEWLSQPDGSITEPVVYVVDRKGTIYDRWEGPAAKNIIEPSVQAVAAGTTFAQ